MSRWQGCLLDDYLRDGLFAARTRVSELTGSPVVNLVSVCIGSTLTAIGLGVLAARGEGERIGWATINVGARRLRRSGRRRGVHRCRGNRADGASDGKARLLLRRRDREPVQPDADDRVLLELRGIQLVHGPGSRHRSTSSRGMPTTCGCRHGCTQSSCARSISRTASHSRARSRSTKRLGGRSDPHRNPAVCGRCENGQPTSRHRRSAYRTTQLVAGEHRFVLTAGRSHIASMISSPGNPEGAAALRRRRMHGRPETIHGWPGAARGVRRQLGGQDWVSVGRASAPARASRPPTCPRVSPRPGSYVRAVAASDRIGWRPCATPVNG